jgi:DNA-directed RNA polymerase subunit RPC12/RpoP
MIVCVPCRKEMLCDKNSVGAKFGEAHVYPGDRFKCPDCGFMILSTNRSPIFDPKLETQDEYLDMEAI